MVMFSLPLFTIGQFQLGIVGPGLDFGRTQFTVGFGGNDVHSIGIGNFGGPLGPGLQPLSALHVNTSILPASPNFLAGEVFRTDCPVGINTHWRLFRDGVELGNIFSDGLAPAVDLDNFSFQSDVQDITFHQVPAVPGTIGLESMRIVGITRFVPGSMTNTNAGNVGIGTKNPLAMLHVGGEGQAAAGWRPWMDVGMYVGSFGGFDNMYVGFKEEGPDRHDAIINWGDNHDSTALPTLGPDKLRFIFTSILGTGGLAGTLDGVEIAQMTFEDRIGRMGITRSDPNAKLHIDINNLPAFGLIGSTVEFHTHLILTHSDSANTRIYTFNSGNHYIDPETFYFNPVTNDIDSVQGRNVGIGLDPAQNGVGEIATEKIDVDGNGRFRLLPDSLYIADPLVDKVVMVDSTGVLRWLDRDSLGGQFGSICGLPNPDTLAASTEIGLNDFNFIFRGNNSGFAADNNVGIGLPIGNCTPKAKLEVCLDSDDFNTTGIFVENFDSTTVFTDRTFGIQAHNSGDGPGRHIGVFALCTTSTAGFNVGGFFVATGSSVRNIGVRACTPQLNPTDRAGQFNGDLQCTTAMFCPSDSILKINQMKIENSLSILTQLTPKTFEFDQGNYSHVVLPTGTRMGLIAQEVEPILPQMIKQTYEEAVYDSLGVEIHPEMFYKSIDYVGFIPLLIAGINEQQEVIEEQDSIIDALDDRLTELENCINSLSLCTSTTMAPETGEGDITTQTIELSDVRNIVLNQNTPNPFADMTSITYFLPNDVQKAQIIFYDINGQMINSVDIAEIGDGMINVFAEDLSSGIYTYVLVADGEIIDTKKMVKNK